MPECEIRWSVQRFEVGEATDPSVLPEAGWVPAVVPGSLAASPAVLQRYGDQPLLDADHAVWWFRGELSLPGPLADAELVLDRLATHAEVWLDGERVLRSDNAFRRHRVPLGSLAAGDHLLAVRVASFDETPVPRKPRARWRSALLPDSSLRWRRTSLLGRIPTWDGALPAVGPLGEVTLGRRPALAITHLRTDWDGRRGLLDLTLVTRDPRPTAVTVAGTALPVDWEPVGETWEARLRAVPVEAEAWWPWHLGEPRLHELRVTQGGEVVLSRRIGFCRIEDRGEDGRFGLRVNGVDDFVRGVCWTPTDPRGWTEDRDAVARDLDRLVGAGITLLRLPGTGTYADEALRELTAQRGLLVWQDAMLATFDPPEDEGWLAELEAELTDQLTAWQGWPQLAVVCGGTETEQQPTLMGLPAERRRMTALHELLPRLAAELVPGAVHVLSSPSGGARPVSIAEGVSHYFGVGAYLRPFEDASTARVSFASEALAFAIPPEVSSMADAPVDRGPGSGWRLAAPHDRGAAWDFVDVTDHYVPAVADAERVAEDMTDQDRWEDLQRLAVVRAVTETFTRWRSSLTPTAGGVVLAHRDLAPGPGWGLLDVSGAPKAPLLALREVLAPVALLLVDRGLDGLLLEAVNDTAEEQTGRLLLAAQDRSGNTVLDAELDLTVPARSRAAVEVEEALGGFRDLTWAWRFGDEPGYSLLDARWGTTKGEVRTTRPLAPLAALRPEPDVAAAARLLDGRVECTVTALAPGVTGVHAALPGWAAEDGWWSLPQDSARTVVLHPLDPTSASPGTVTVRTLTGAPVRVPVEAPGGSD